MKKAIVVGSGAGGCAAARILSSSFDVTVLEAGAPFEPFSYKLSTFEPARRAGWFFDERMIELLFPPMRIQKEKTGSLVHVTGRCIGGTTALATGNALRYDGALAKMGLDLDAEFAELDAIVPQTQQHYKKWSDLTVRLFDAFEQLGYNPQVTPKFMEDTDRCVACGHCVLGCRYGAKWTADRLLDDLENLTVRPGCTVCEVVREGGRATGVTVREGLGRKKFIPADLVVLAAGGLGTPVILNASDIPTKPTLFVDPVICVAAPWEGARLDTQLPMPFVAQRDEYILSPYFDWLSFFFNGQWIRPSRDIMSIMVKYADTSIGSYNGRKLDKPATTHDEEIVIRSVEESKRVLDLLGVPRDQMFLGTVNAGHPGGCFPLTPDEVETLHKSSLPENVYVADASLLPQSMGNPPILTIMALAQRVARVAAERFA